MLLIIKVMTLIYLNSADKLGVLEEKILEISDDENGRPNDHLYSFENFVELWRDLGFPKLNVLNKPMQVLSERSVVMLDFGRSLNHVPQEMDGLPPEND